MFNVCPMCEESTKGEAVFMLSLSCFAKGVSWGLDSSLSFFGAKSSLPPLWRAFLAIRLVFFFFLKNFLIWFPVDVASLVPNLWNFPLCFLRHVVLLFWFWRSFFSYHHQIFHRQCYRTEKPEHPLPLGYLSVWEAVDLWSWVPVVLPILIAWSDLWSFESDFVSCPLHPSPTTLVANSVQQVPEENHLFALSSAV